MSMKAKIRKTGEIVEVISYNGLSVRSPGDVVNYIDSKGVERSEHMNYFWDFKLIDDLKESLRAKAAIAVLQGLLSDRETYTAAVRSAEQSGTDVAEGLAGVAVNYADALIVELEKDR